MGAGLSGQRKDFQIARLAIWSSRPDAAKALVFSPDVQRLKQEQVAIDYLRQLMEGGQERLREIDKEKQARMDQERKSCREQRER